MRKLFTLLLAVAAGVGTMFASTLIGDLYYNLNDESQTAEVADNYGVGGEIIIPSNVTYNEVEYSVTSIGNEAFRNCTGLTSVTIGNSVTSIGEWAFRNCSGLTSVTIGNSVTSIGELAFRDCTSLTSVTIGNSVTRIGEYVFYDCIHLTSITIPNSVTSIGNFAFGDCTGLTSVTIPNSVTSIGEGAFYGCESLTAPVYNAYVFAFMPTSYSGAYTIPDGIESIAGTAFYDCSSLTSVTIPNSVTSIGETAFAFCTGLTSVTIPNSVTSIGSSAFSKCSGLTSVTIGNSVTSIGDYAFEYCSSLTSVTIPNSVTSIGEGAFYGCKSLSAIFNYATSPQVIDSEVFGGGEFEHDGVKYGPVDKSICKLYVPQESINFYKVALVWRDFKNILPIGAQTVDVTTTTVTPSATTADIAWPQVSGAASYELVIKDKNGNVVCTLVFDAEGRLNSINFAAPGKDHNRKQTQTAGFAFSITGLEGGTTYNYTLTAKDSNGKVLSTETGAFTTEGAPQGIDNTPFPSGEGRGEATKLLRNGQILILRGDKTYTLTGVELK